MAGYIGQIANRGSNFNSVTLPTFANNGLDLIRAKSDGTTEFAHAGSILGAPVFKTASFTLGRNENVIICQGTEIITATLSSVDVGRIIRLENNSNFSVVSASSNIAQLGTGELSTLILPGIAGSWTDLQWDGIKWNVTASSAILLAGTALSGLETAHGSQFLLGAGGHAPWNHFGAALNMGNTEALPNTVVANGIMAAKLDHGVDADGMGFAVYQVTGTASGTSLLSLTNSIMTLAPAAAGQTWTLSGFAQIIDGTVPTHNNTGFRLDIAVLTASNAYITQNPAVSAVRPTAETLVSMTWQLAGANIALARAQVVLRTESGQTVNYTIRIKGLQFEQTPARTVGKIREIPVSEGFLMMAQPGARLGYADGEYTAQHSVTSGIPLDSSAPLWTEGAHLISVNYVPKKIGSKLLITATLPLVATTGTPSAIAVIYVDEVSQRVGAFTPSGTSYNGNITVRHVLTVASLNSVKVSLRFGPQTGGFTAFINRSSDAGGSNFGGKVSTLLTVEEIAQ